MTREEAIINLKLSQNRIGGMKKEEWNALQMAIKALQTEAEQTDCTEFIMWLIEVVLDDDDWELNAVAYGEIIARKLKKFGLLEVKDGYYVRTPSADAEWISCSERLPDIDTPVIICTASGGITDGYRWNEKDWFLAWSEYNGWHDGNDGGRITAWMPLPTPYKGGDDE